MTESAGRRGWRRAIDSYLAKFDASDITVGQMFALWASAVTVVILVCIAFFGTVYWLFN